VTSSKRHPAGLCLGDVDGVTYRANAGLDLKRDVMQGTLPFQFFGNDRQSFQERPNFPQGYNATPYAENLHNDKKRDGGRQSKIDKGTTGDGDDLV